MRFRSPDYELLENRGSVTWRIERLLVSRDGWDQGFLRLSVARVDEPAAGERVAVRVQIEVRNFYPWLRGSGRFARVGVWLYSRHSSASFEKSPGASCARWRKRPRRRGCNARWSTMGCELQASVIGDDEERSQRLLDVIGERADGIEDVIGGRRFTFLSADCPEVKQSLSTLLYRHDADWHAHVSF